MSCHLCGYSVVEQVLGYEALKRVSSDCKPWVQGGWLGVCQKCCGVQKRIDEKWKNEAESVYLNYSIYHQGAGAEQISFKVDLDQVQTRSDRIVDKLFLSGLIKNTGRLIDIGCGNGALLKAFSRRKVNWILNGIEINDKYKNEVEKIPGVNEMLVGDIGIINRKYDLITLVHVLEHIPNPSLFLKELIEKIEIDGFVMIEVPNYEENEFDLLVVDHITHFSPCVLDHVCTISGLQSKLISTEWIAKEISVVSNVQKNILRLTKDLEFNDVIKRIKEKVNWLTILASNARKVSREKAVGIFGTSIAGTWLYGELDGKIDFFVDEDKNRIGQILFGKKIISPDEMPNQTKLFVPFPDKIAFRIKQKLEIKNKLSDILIPATLF